MKTYKYLTSVIALSCSAGAFAGAPVYSVPWEDGPIQSKPAISQPMNGNFSALCAQCPASELIGSTVVSRNNQDLGTIKDIVVNLNRGRICFAIIGFEGRKVAVPTSQLVPQQEGREFTALVSRQQLRSAPDFAQADLQNPAWSSDIYAYYNVAAGQAIKESAGAPLPGPTVTARDQDQQWDQILQLYSRGKQSASQTDAWLQQQNPNSFYVMYPAQQEVVTEAAGAQAPAPETLVRSSDLNGMTVYDDRGQQVGAIKDVTVDWPTGRVVYAVLNPQGTMPSNNRFYAIPPQALVRSAAGATLTLAIDRDRLASAPSFDSSHWPSPSDQSFVTQVYQFYNTPMYWQEK